MNSSLPTPEQMTDILDIQPIVRLNLDWIFWGLGIFLLVLILGFLFSRYFNNRKKIPKAQKISLASVSPSEAALKALSELDAMGLLERGQFRKYYFELSEILRRFLEEVFKIPAIDATTEEILPKLKTSRFFSDESQVMVRKNLIHMDLVKFAKLTPSPTEIQGLYQDLKQLFSKPVSSSSIDTFSDQTHA